MDAASSLSLSPSQTRTARIPIVAGLLLTLLLAALDATIVATAMPSIAAELRGLDRYSWVTVAYLLSSTVCVPIVGKLADQYGRRPFLLAGAATFVIASVLCALAATLNQLVAFRLLQGVGAGMITASVFAAVPRLFDPAARARVVGVFTATYGLASIVGPLLGGVITDLAGWRGVFWLNLPLGLVAIALVLLTYPVDRSEGTGGSVDHAGAATLILGLSPILLALLLGGRDIPWDSPTMAALLLFGALFLAAFVWIERRASQPIIPLRDLATRALGAPVLGSTLMNAGLIATLVFTPLFVQGVIGQSATQSGGVLAPMTTAWVAASVISGQIIARFKRTRATAVSGMTLAALGLWLMSGMGVGTDYVVVARNLVVVGIGLGAAVAAFVLAAQDALPLERSGVATSLTTFARALGATVATAALGGVLVAQIGGQAAAAVDPQVLSGALGALFSGAGALAALGAVTALLMRARRSTS